MSSSRINEIDNLISQIKDKHAGAMLAHGQDQRMIDLVTIFENEFKSLGSSGKRAFDKERIEANPSETAEFECLMKKLLKERTELEESNKDEAQKVLKKFIHAVNENDSNLVSRMLKENDLDPMQGPVEGKEDIDMGDGGRIQRPRYGSSALLVAILSQNRNLLDILLENVPDEWPEKLQQLFRKAMEEGKLYAVACILRHKKYPVCGGTCIKRFAEIHELWGAHYLLGLELEESGYFMNHWSEILSIVDFAEQRRTPFVSEHLQRQGRPRGWGDE